MPLNLIVKKACNKISKRQNIHRLLDFRYFISYISVMTEIADIEKTPEAVERFILHWGDLGGTWGVNRTVAQIHALLYLTEHPLNAEDIQMQLKVARSNVSNSLKELLALRLIRRFPLSLIHI